MDLHGRIRDRRHRRWMERARRGHEPSFTRLFRELHGPVHGFVARRVGDPDEVEDVVARVFVRFVERLDRFEPSRGSVWTWTMTLARHAVVDHHRGRRRVLEPIEDHAESLASKEPDALRRLLEDEEGRLLHGRLAGEPAETREMFALHFADGLTYREIAQVLGLGEAAVKQRFARTMRRLRAARSEQRKGGERDALVMARTQGVEDPARS